jgi:hypothetical protein
MNRPKISHTAQSRCGRSEIEAFLVRVRNVLRNPQRFDLIPRAGTNATIIALGLTREALRQEILALEVEDYHTGPQPDHDRPGDIWIFGRQIEDTEVYIKLKLVKDPVTKVEHLKCLSFHKARFRMRYPFTAGRAN